MAGISATSWKAADILETENIMSEMMDKIHWVWLDTIEEKIHELEDTGNKNIQSETQNE